jgi:hypothetical protein
MFFATIQQGSIPKQNTTYNYGKPYVVYKC